MKKQVLSFVAMVGLLMTLTVVFVSGQQTRLMTATIPFDFTIGQKTLPAGKYEIYHNGRPNALVIRSMDCRVNVMFLTNSVQAKRALAEAQLVFRRYGDQYFLGQLWSPGDDVGHESPQSRRERELINEKHLAQRAAEPEFVYIAAQ